MKTRPLDKHTDNTIQLIFFGPGATLIYERVCLLFFKQNVEKCRERVVNAWEMRGKSRRLIAGRISILVQYILRVGIDQGVQAVACPWADRGALQRMS